MECPFCRCRARATGIRLAAETEVYRCAACDTEFLHPKPSGSDLSARYGREYYDAWGTGAGAGLVRMKQATAEAALNIVRRYVPSGPLLDVGCAAGHLLTAAAARGYDPFGVDISEHACGMARESVGRDRIFCGALEDCSFPRESFAAVVMMDSLEHVNDPLRTLRAARELLRRRGVLLVVTPDMGAMSRKLMGAHWPHYKPEHLFYFSRASLVKLAREAGFDTIRIGRARKAVNLSYLHAQCSVYRHSLLTPAVRAASLLLPAALRERNLFVSMGEMVAVFLKP